MRQIRRRAGCSRALGVNIVKPKPTTLANYFSAPHGVLEASAVLVLSHLGPTLAREEGSIIDGKERHQQSFRRTSTDGHYNAHFEILSQQLKDDTTRHSRAIMRRFARVSPIGGVRAKRAKAAACCAKRYSTSHVSMSLGSLTERKRTGWRQRGKFQFCSDLMLCRPPSCILTTSTMMFNGCCTHHQCLPL